MNIGIVGLGKMGLAIAQRLLNAGHTVFGFDPDEQTRILFAQHGGKPSPSLSDMCQETSLVWLMVPNTAVDTILEIIIANSAPGSIVIDGGNSFYKDSIRRAKLCKDRNITFLDCGTSGGIHGLHHGFCLMVGGDTAAYRTVYPLFQAIAPAHGVMHVGPSGAGHYVKMVHNGIEYGILQAYAEGFHLLKEGTFKSEHLDLAAIAQVWNHGSIIRSFILQLTQQVLQENNLHTTDGSIEELGTGKWTLQEAQEQHIPTPALHAALEVRNWSRQSGGNYATTLIALLRHAFGGHPIKSRKE